MPSLQEQAGRLRKDEIKLGFELTCPHCARKLSYTPRDLRHHPRFREAHLVTCRACAQQFPASVVEDGPGWFLVKQWGARWDGPGGSIQFYPQKESMTWERE